MSPTLDDPRHPGQWVPGSCADPVTVESYACQLPLDPGSALVITGSLSSNPADRWLTREQIWPVQVVFDGRAHLAPSFRLMGKFGASSFALPVTDDLSAPVYFSCGSELYALDLERRAATSYPVPGLNDVHEITQDKSRILIANTGRDEVVSFWPQGGTVSRLPLGPFRGREAAPADEGRPVDRFHVNQVFRGLDGALWALVHHFEGWQLLRRVIGGFIKTHGDGGLLNLDEKRALNLGLAAPHSVRVVGDEYWLMNSARNEIITYSSAWQKRRTIASIGWGRGLAVCGGLVYAGISPVRRRYRPRPDPSPTEAMIQALRISTGESLACATVLNVEQINNVYCVTRPVAARLLSM